jgi:hypothetical protein
MVLGAGRARRRFQKFQNNSLRGTHRVFRETRVVKDPRRKDFSLTELRFANYAKMGRAE